MNYQQQQHQQQQQQPIYQNQSPIPVTYQPPMQHVRYVQQPVEQPVQYVQQPVEQPLQYVQQVQQQYAMPQKIQKPINAMSQAPSTQTRDIGEIVTGVIGEDTMKETMKDEEIKLLKSKLDILDDKLSEMIAKKVRKFCF